VAEDVDGEPAPWFSQLLDYCREKGLQLPDKHDDADLLKASMEKGFPDRHRLVVTTDFVDRRKALFKAIDETGLVVNCTVPKGETRADRMARDAVTKTTIDAALAQAGKRMAADARQRLMQWTGFDLRTLCGSLEKLISYAGDRQTITNADVTRGIAAHPQRPYLRVYQCCCGPRPVGQPFFDEKPVGRRYAPAAALGGRGQPDSTAPAGQRLYREGPGPLLVGHASYFPSSKTFRSRRFRRTTGTSATLFETWESILNPSDRRAKNGKKAASSDLVLAKNPKSPFPVYQTLKKADPFSLDTLISAMIDLSETDLTNEINGPGSPDAAGGLFDQACARINAAADQKQRHGQADEAPV
jgi:DNA polymerase-3 subunit delta